MRFLISLFLISFFAAPLGALAHSGETHIEVLPSSLVYEAGQEVTVTVMLHAANEATSVRVELLYDQDVLQVKEIESNTETFPFWGTSEAANGMVLLEAYAPAPGVAGDVAVATIVFEATQSASSEITVSDTSLVLNAEDENLLEKPAESPEGIQAGPPQSSEAGLGGVQIAPGLLIGAVVLGVVVVGAGIVVFLRQQKKM